MQSNIAEGASRTSKKYFNRFLQIALGSSFELETQLLIFKDLKLSKESEVSEIISKNDEVQKMLNSLMKAVVKLDG